MRVYRGMKDWFTRRPALAWGVSITLLIVAGFALGIRPRSALVRYKQELTTRGEVLDWAKLAPTQTDESLRFHQTMGELASGLVGKPIAFGELNYGSKSTNGFAMPLWAQEEPAEPGKGTWADLALQLETSQRSLQLLRTLITNPPAGSRYDPNDPFGNPGPNGALIAKRRATQAFAASAIDHLRKQQLPEAIEDLHSLIDLARLDEPAALLVEHMIRVSICGIVHAVVWEALQAPGWTEPQLLLLATKLEALEFASRLPRVIETERAYGLAAFAASRTNKGGLLLSLGASPQNFPIAERAYAVIYESLLSEGDEFYLLQKTQAFLDATRVANTKTNRSARRVALADAAHRVAAEKPWLSRWRFPASQMVIPNWDRAVTSILKAEIRHQMALIAIALQSYLVRHGSLPTSLANLSHDHLPQLPTDALSNGAVTYERIDSTRFRLFSPGANGLNDGGKGDDVIWAAPTNVSPTTNSRQR